MGLHHVAVCYFPLCSPSKKKIPRKQKRRSFPPVKISAFPRASVVSCIPEHLKVFNSTVQRDGRIFTALVRPRLGTRSSLGLRGAGSPVDAQSRAAGLQAGLQTPQSPVYPELFPDCVHSDFRMTSNAFNLMGPPPPVVVAVVVHAALARLRQPST